MIERYFQEAFFRPSSSDICEEEEKEKV